MYFIHSFYLFKNINKPLYLLLDLTLPNQFGDWAHEEQLYIYIPCIYNI